MRILVIACHRPQKTLEPLKCIKADFQAVTSTPKCPRIVNFPKQVADILVKSKTYKPDIVLCHGVIYIGLVAFIVAKLNFKPFVIRMAGDLFEGYRAAMVFYRNNRQVIRLIKLWLMNRIVLFVMRRSDGIITPSHNLKERFLSQLGRDLPNIEVVPVPCDIRKFTQTSADSINGTEFRGNKIILTVTNLGILEKLEGLKEALPALASVLEQRQNVVFLIAGGGEFLNEIKSYIEKNHAALLDKGRIILLGLVKEIEKLYAIADIIVYYSLRDGCPNVMLEAWASKKPLVVNDSDWSREHVKKGTALIARNKSDLIEKVEMLLDSDEAREELSDAGYKHVSQNYSNEVVGKKLAEALSKLIKKPPAKANVKGLR